MNAVDVVYPSPGRWLFSSASCAQIASAMLSLLTQVGAPLTMGANGYHKFSMDLVRCKNATNIGENTAEWHGGTCQSAGYTKPYVQRHVLAGFSQAEWVKPGYSASSLAHYKIPAWADPHYSSSGNDRNYG